MGVIDLQEQKHLRARKSVVTRLMQAAKAWFSANNADRAILMISKFDKGRPHGYFLTRYTELEFYNQHTLHPAKVLGVVNRAVTESDLYAMLYED